MRAAVIIGTRPEQIKLLPVARALAADVIYTGQHALDAPSLEWHGLRELPCDLRGYDVVVVEGDTFSTFAGAWTAFMAGVPVAHVEAGLRTRTKFRPFPEEMLRRLVGEIADVHFAPTARAAENLVRRENVFVVGNTVVDAALEAAKTSPRHPERYALATVHRRESWGAATVEIVKALNEVSRTLVPIKLLTHHSTRAEVLEYARDIEVLPAQTHAATIGLVRDAALVLTDSGGIQEEAPIFGTPLVVLRNETERIEGVEAGVARLAGTSFNSIVEAAHEMIQMPRVPCMIYGDGRASERIAAKLREMYA